MIESILNQADRGEVITFYSFKGGVGRSMALANVAAVYAQRGKRVLALDFDFEAPGLHRYFLVKENDKERYAPAGPQKGVLNLFDSLRAWLGTTFPEGHDFQGAETQKKVRAFVAEQLDSGQYLYQVRLKNPNVKTTPDVQIDFVAAALFDATYPELVRTFDWQDFYDKYAEVFPAIVKTLTSRYAVVLVDSRTGVTDIGSICTMVLPDKLVLVFTPNEQSLSGALDAGWQAVQGRNAAPEPRVLPIFPLVSRVEDNEGPQKREWLARVRQSFEQLLSDANRQDVDLEAYFNVVRILQKSYFAYGEHIAATEQPANETGSMAQAFQHLADALEFPDAIKAQHMPLELTVNTTIAQASLRLGQENEALRLFNEVIREARDFNEPSAKAAFVASLLGKAAALSRLRRFPEALDTAEDALTRSENTDDWAFRDDAVRSALIVLGNTLIRSAKEPLQLGEAINASALLARAESKLSLLRQRFPQDPSLFGYSAYAAFLAGRQDEARTLLTKAMELGGAKHRNALLSLAAADSVPQDDEFRALLASIPDPPAGSAPSA